MTYIVQAWVDGSVTPSNPGEVSSGAAILYSPSSEIYTVNAIIERGGRQTNNIGEVTAMTAAIRPLNKHRKIHLTIVSDSMYAIDGLTKYITIKKRYKKNFYYWSKLFEQVDAHKNVKIELKHIKGHTGDFFNEAAHAFAYKAAQQGKGIYHKHIKFKELNDILQAL